MKETNQTNETTPEESHDVLPELRDALQNAVDEGDMQRAGELKAQIMPHLEALKQSLDSPDALAQAREIMRADFFGPDEVGMVFRTKIEKKDIPDIPFSKRELERAKELGQALILRIDNLGENLPLNMGVINAIISSNNAGIEEDCALNEVGLEQDRNEDFFTKETPRKGWALVGMDCIPGSLNKDYLDQISAMLGYLNKEVFPEALDLKPEYTKAIDRLRNELPVLKKFAARDKRTGGDSLGRALERLDIVKLTRQTPVEAFYDSVIYYTNTGCLNLFENDVVTSRKDSKGNFIIIDSRPGQSGTTLVHQSSYYSHDNLGTVFARRS